MKLTDGGAETLCPECLSQLAWNSALHKLRAECLEMVRPTQLRAVNAVLEKVENGNAYGDFAKWFEIDGSSSGRNEWQIRLRLVELWVEEVVSKLTTLTEEED